MDNKFVHTKTRVIGNTSQISDLHAQLAALRADAERRETTLQKLDYELALSSKSSVSQQQQLQEREKAQHLLLRQLKGVSVFSYDQSF